jgi:hypothetical protein
MQPVAHSRNHQLASAVCLFSVGPGRQNELVHSRAPVTG